MRNFIKYFPQNIRMNVSVNDTGVIDLVMVEFRQSKSNINSWTEYFCLSYVGSELCLTTHFVLDEMTSEQLNMLSLANNLANSMIGALIENVNIDDLIESD